MGSVRMTQVTALVLQAVAAGHHYGFDVMDATGLASGTIYPALRRLEEAELLRGHWESATAAHEDGRPPRRLYRLTRQGTAALDAAARKLAHARAVISSLSPPAEVES
jgi:DNA-binding PadR family transcriptional regulator